MNGSTTTVLSPIADAIGRVLLVALFLVEGVSKLRGYDLAVKYMAAFGMPAVLLPAAIAVELGCSALIVLGWQTRLAALPLAGFCLVTALIFHINLGTTNETLHFGKDLALAGAFSIVAAHGAGRLSLDAWLNRNRP